MSGGDQWRAGRAAHQSAGIVRVRLGAEVRAVAALFAARAGVSCAEWCREAVNTRISSAVEGLKAEGEGKHAN